MGILPDEHRRADFNPGGFGYRSFDDTFSTIDRINPHIGATYKIGGQIYELQYVIDVLEFVKIEE